MSGAVAALSRLLPRRPNLLLVGNPALIWRIAPAFARPLVITLLDQDRASLDAALDAVVDEAGARGIVTSWPGRALLLHVPGAAWRIEAAVVPDLSATVLRRLNADALIVQGAVPSRPPRTKLLLLDLPVAPPRLLPVMAEPWLREAWRRDHATLGRELDALRIQGWQLARWPRTRRTHGRNVHDAHAALDRLVRALSLHDIARWREWHERRTRQARHGRLVVQRRLLDVLATPDPSGRGGG